MLKFSPLKEFKLRFKSNLKGEKGDPGIGFKLTDDGHFDVQGKRLTNVGRPQKISDSVTLRELRSLEATFSVFQSQIRTALKNIDEKLLETKNKISSIESNVDRENSKNEVVNFNDKFCAYLKTVEIRMKMKGNTDTFLFRTAKESNFLVLINNDINYCKFVLTGSFLLRLLFEVERSQKFFIEVFVGKTMKQKLEITEVGFVDRSLVINAEAQDELTFKLYLEHNEIQTLKNMYLIVERIQ